MSCLFLYWFCANAGHSLAIWLVALPFWLHFLHLVEMLVPSMALWMNLVVSVWACAAIIIPSVSFLSSPSEAIAKYNCWTGLWSVLETGHAWAYFACLPSGTLMFSPYIPVGLHLLWSSLLPMHFLTIHLCSSSGIDPETFFQHWCILLSWVDLSLFHCVVRIVYLLWSWVQCLAYI